MLKVQVITVGVDKDPWVTEACKHYIKMLSKFAVVELVTVRTARTASSLSSDEIQREEADRIRQKLPKGLIIALADTGKRVDSIGFSRLLERWQTASRGTIAFVIGGPHGLSEQLLAAADEILSLSPLTFSHQLARPILLEQLYRGFTILHNTSYHK